MKKPKKILEIFEKYTPLVDKEIKALLKEQDNLLMYDMMSYFFGYLDENLKEINDYGGKRFRPGLCLLLSDFYGTANKAVEAATAIEIFHNFTLIHDDIADHDEQRRGRPTIWKKWGVNHAINTGDAQLILVSLEMQKIIERDANNGSLVFKYLNERFLEIAEGQFMDFTLSELPISDSSVKAERTLEMIGRKSGILVGAPAVVAGMIAEKSQSELEHLWDYGYNLGLTYQLCDDIISIWGKKDESGKDELADIREKKKTLPIIYLYENADISTKNELKELYNKKELLNSKEIVRVKNMLDNSSAHEYILDVAKKSLEKIENSIDRLTINQYQKNMLYEINKALFAVLWENKC